MSALKLEVEIDTSKAKKGLQDLAKQTSQNISVQQSRRQEKWQQNRQQQHQTTKGSSNLVGLAALGTSLAALSKVSEKQSEKIVETTKEMDALNKSIEYTRKQIEYWGERVGREQVRSKNLQDPNFYKTMGARSEYRRHIAYRQRQRDDYELGLKPMDPNWSEKQIDRYNYHKQKMFEPDPTFRDWATRRMWRANKRIERRAKLSPDQQEIEPFSVEFTKKKKSRAQQEYSAQIRKMDSLNRRMAWLQTGTGNRRALNAMGRLGSGIRDIGVSKLTNFASMTRGIPLVGGMLSSAGTGTAGWLGGLGTTGLTALGTSAAVAAPIVGAVGGTLLAGKKMVGDGRQAQDQISQLNASLGQLQFNQTGSRNVRELTDEIMKLSINGVNSVDDLNAATNALMVSFGGNSDEVKKWLPLIDDMAAATGVSASQMGEMIARVNESGVAESRVINSLSTKGIPIYRELGEVMGKSTEEAKKMAKAGEISAATFEKAMQRIGKSVKGTSEQLSSTTLAGAQASWEAADSYAHKGAAEAYDREKIASLNAMTEEAMKEAQDGGVQAMRAAAGATWGALESTLAESWDWLTGFAIDSFGAYSSVLLRGHTRATSNLNAEIETKIKEMQKSGVELTEETINAQVKALQDYRKQLKHQLSFTVGGVDVLSSSTRREVENTILAIDEMVANRSKSYLKMIQQREKDAEKAKKEFDAAFQKGMEKRELQKQKQIKNRRTELDKEFYNKILANPQNQVALDSAYEGLLATYGVTPENAAETADRLRASEYENPDIYEGFAERAEQIRELMAAYEEATNTLKERAEEEKRRLEEEKRRLEEEKREREHTNLQFRAAMGDDAAKGELMLFDRAREIMENQYLSKNEKDAWLQSEANQIYKDLAKDAIEGVFVGGSDCQSFYGEKKGPKEATTGYISNAWNASCRTFMQFQKDYSKEQYNELKRTTEAAKETAKGVQTLVQRFTVAAQ